MRHTPLFHAGLFAAVLFASAHASGAGADPTKATATQTQQAQVLFGKAHAAFEKRDYATALSEAKGSWEIVASPNARIFVARCLRELGRFTEAYTEYAGTIADANALATREARYTETAKAATDERKAIEARIALLTVDVDQPLDDTRVTVAGVVIPRGAWSTPMPENPGKIDIVAEAGGKEVDHRSVTLSAGNAQSISIEGYQPPPATMPGPPLVAVEQGPATARQGSEGPTSSDGKRRLRTYSYVAGGVGGVGLVLFGIFGALDQSTYGGLQSACPNNVCPASKIGDASTGKTYQLAANVGLGVGLAGAAAFGTLFLLSLGGKSGEPARADTTTSLVVSPGFVGLRGAL